jgi:copper(I)-binding protein
MDRRNVRGAVATALGLGLALAACAGEAPARKTAVAVTDGFQVFDAYAPASAAPDVASAYFTLVNTGSLPDTLVGVTSSVGRAMMHTERQENGLTRMVPVPRIPVPAGDTLRFRFGGYHVMITGLAAPPAVGDTIMLTLRLASGKAIAVSALVVTYSDAVERLEAADRRR